MNVVYQSILKRLKEESANYQISHASHNEWNIQALCKWQYCCQFCKNANFCKKYLGNETNYILHNNCNTKMSLTNLYYMASECV